MILGTPLGYLMYLCFVVTQNYLVSLVLFTLLSRIILFPLSLYAYNNSIRLAKIKPRLNDIKRHYSGDKDRIVEEQQKLYKTEKYIPFISFLPPLVQLFLIIGLIHVLYNPMQYLLQVPHNAIPGINFGLMPPLRWSVYLLIPVFSGLTSLLLCVVQRKIHVVQREQSKAAHWGMSSFFMAFAICLAFVVPAGVGFYWSIGNLLAILTLMLCNTICKPEKHINYKSRPKPAPVDKVARKANRLRESADYKRFMLAEKRRLVFYSAKSGVYKYFKGVLEYVLDNSDIHIHYVTSDPNDVIFRNNSPQLTPYYISDRKLISLMTNLNTDMMVMTTPDLHKYHIKRSTVRKDIEYVYMFHAVVSTHMMYRAGAFNYYDTIFCVGQYHIDEIRATEMKYNLKQKRLIPCGYSLIDELTAGYEAVKKEQSDAGKILIAPSWQFDNIMESCLDELLEQLLGKGYKIVVRPHPEFVKRFPDKMDAIFAMYADKQGKDFVIEIDFSSNVTIFTADLLITDWSGIAFEYAYATKRPCLFINTPMKVMNINYKDIGIVPVEVSLRDKIGISINMDNMGVVSDTVVRLFTDAESYKQQITVVLQENMFCIGHSSEIGGQYIIDSLQHKKLK